MRSRGCAARTSPAWCVYEKMGAGIRTALSKTLYWNIVSLLRRNPSRPRPRRTCPRCVMRKPLGGVRFAWLSGTLVQKSWLRVAPGRARHFSLATEAAAEHAQIAAHGAGVSETRALIATNGLRLCAPARRPCTPATWPRSGFVARPLTTYQDQASREARSDAATKRRPESGFCVSHSPNGCRRAARPGCQTHDCANRVTSADRSADHRQPRRDRRAWTLRCWCSGTNLPRRPENFRLPFTRTCSVVRPSIRSGTDSPATRPTVQDSGTALPHHGNRDDGQAAPERLATVAGAGPRIAGLASPTPACALVP